MAEVGVVLLLFVIGMEFGLKKLAALGRTVFVGGLLQATLTTAVAGTSHSSACVWKALCSWAFWSPCTVLRSFSAFSEKGKIDSTYGRAATAILISRTSSWSQ